MAVVEGERKGGDGAGKKTTGLPEQCVKGERGEKREFQFQGSERTKKKPNLYPIRGA